MRRRRTLLTFLMFTYFPVLEALDVLRAVLVVVLIVVALKYSYITRTMLDSLTSSSHKHTNRSYANQYARELAPLAHARAAYVRGANSCFKNGRSRNIALCSLSAHDWRSSSLLTGFDADVTGDIAMSKSAFVSVLGTAYYTRSSRAAIICST